MFVGIGYIGSNCASDIGLLMPVFKPGKFYGKTQKPVMIKEGTVGTLFKIGSM